MPLVPWHTRLEPGPAAGCNALSDFQFRWHRPPDRPWATVRDRPWRCWRSASARPFHNTRLIGGAECGLEGREPRLFRCRPLGAQSGIGRHAQAYPMRIIEQQFAHQPRNEIGGAAFGAQLFQQWIAVQRRQRIAAVDCRGQRASMSRRSP